MNDIYRMLWALQRFNDRHPEGDGQYRLVIYDDGTGHIASEDGARLEGFDFETPEEAEYKLLHR